MADITKCFGDKYGASCPLKESCYRFKAPSSDRQSYFMNIPYDKKQKKCNHYWKIKTDERNNL